MLQDLLGMQLDLPVRVAIAAIVIVALLGLTVFIVRRLSGGGHMSGGRSRQARLAVLDSVAVDQRRRLVLVRRDEVEHLLLVGGTNDIVVEPAIGRGLTRDALAAREAAQREAPPVRETTQLREPASAPREMLPRRTSAPSLTPPPASLTPPAASTAAPEVAEAEPEVRFPPPAAPEAPLAPAARIGAGLEPRRPLTERRPLRGDGEAAPRPARPLPSLDRPARAPSSFSSGLRRVPSAKLPETESPSALEPPPQMTAEPSVQAPEPAAEAPKPKSSGSEPVVPATEPAHPAPEPQAPAAEPKAEAPEIVPPAAAEPESTPATKAQEDAVPEVSPPSPSPNEAPARRIPLFSISRPNRGAQPSPQRTEPQIGEMANRLEATLGAAAQPKPEEASQPEAAARPTGRITPARFSPMMRAAVPPVVPPQPPAPAQPVAPEDGPNAAAREAVVQNVMGSTTSIENDLVRELELTLAREAEAEAKAPAETPAPEPAPPVFSPPVEVAEPPPEPKPSEDKKPQEDKSDPFEDLEAEMATLLGRTPAQRQ